MTTHLIDMPESIELHGLIHDNIGFMILGALEDVLTGQEPSVMAAMQAAFQHCSDSLIDGETYFKPTRQFGIVAVYDAAHSIHDMYRVLHHLGWPVSYRCHEDD